MSAREIPQAAPDVPDLLGVLAARKAQAEALPAAYAAATVARDTMLYWLAQAAKRAREAAGRKQVHVAASANKDQSTIYRFERGESWPQDTDLFVAAYADDLDIDPVELWQAALDLWRESGDQATVPELEGRREARRAKRQAPERELDADLEEEAQRTRGRGEAGGRKQRAPRAAGRGR